MPYTHGRRRTDAGVLIVVRGDLGGEGAQERVVRCGRERWCGRLHACHPRDAAAAQGWCDGRRTAGHASRVRVCVCVWAVPRVRACVF